MATLNETSDLQTRIQQAKAWLQERDNEEAITTAARIFNITRTTLSSSIHRPSGDSRGGLNRILTSGQEQSINLFIQSDLNHGLLPTKGVLISAITCLRALENKPPPSASWFQKWWKTQPLHKIKTKPIARVRITAQDKDEVSQWFVKYKEVVKKHEVSRKDIWNFDETGFRIGCPKGEEIYVPLDVKEVSYYLRNKG
jgi:phage gp46-like protein